MQCLTPEQPCAPHTESAVLPCRWRDLGARAARVGAALLVAAFVAGCASLPSLEGRPKSG